VVPVKGNVLVGANSPDAEVRVARRAGAFAIRPPGTAVRLSLPLRALDGIGESRQAGILGLVASGQRHGVSTPPPENHPP
jgi:hypothetical protein